MGDSNFRSGNKLKRQGKLEEAIVFYRQAIEANPNFSWYHYELGKTLAEQGKLKEAVSHLKKAATISPESPIFKHKLEDILTLIDKNNELYQETMATDGELKEINERQIPQINDVETQPLKYAIVTTFSSRGYQQYARRMLETYDRYLPSEVDIYAYYEGELPHFHSNRIYYRNLEKLSPDLVWFKKECEKAPLKCGMTSKGYNLQFDARRFSHKSFSVFHCTQNTDADIVYWFDADSVAFQDVPMSFVENLLPPEYYTSYLGREHIKRYSECGFVGYNVKHFAHKEFMAAWHQLYMSGDLFELPEWHDCTSYDSVRKKLEQEGKIKSNNLSKDIRSGHPFVNSILGEYFDHLKGTSRKQKGKSLQKDIVRKRSEEYWDFAQQSDMKLQGNKEKLNLPLSQKSLTEILWKPLENPSSNRYRQVIDCINLFKPASIIEVGTWNGNRALEMAKAALKYQEKVHYIGFDLFEDATEETDAVELNVKRHNTVAEISDRLREFQKTNPGFTFELVKGNTRETLKQPRVADFAYIDGGHSVETIRNDYQGLKDCPVILFDDYYVADSQGKCPDLTIFGCNEIVKNLPHCILPMTGNIKGGGLTAMALATGGSKNTDKSKELTKLNRYTQVANSIHLFKPTSIIEVGTWNGDRALEMVKTALKHRKKVHYIGFDLFEDATEETDAVELNVKRHNTVAEISARLREFQKTNPGFTFELVKGNTRETLKQPRVADFAYIDGGHSLETIRNDYEGLKDCPVILFDDYYVADSQGRCPDLRQFGCNDLVDNLPHYVLPITGAIKDGGLTAMALVMGVNMTTKITSSLPKVNPYIASGNGQYGVFEGNIEDKAIFAHYRLFGVWAPEIQYLLIKKLFPPERDGSYLDIGANIGLTVIPLAERRRKVDCYAFEPDPENYSLLEKNIAVHRLKSRVETYPVALLSEQETVSFELCLSNRGDNRVRKENIASLPPNLKGEDTREVIKIQAEQLDDLLSADNLKKPIVVNLDIQGSELRFFQGASRFLESVDYLIVKFWPYGLRRLGDTPEAFLSALKQFPFAGVLKKFPMANSTSDDYISKQLPKQVKGYIEGIAMEPIDEAIARIEKELPFKNNIKYTGHLTILCSRHSQLDVIETQKPNLVSSPNNITSQFAETEKLDLSKCKKNITSQFGEDGIIEAIFNKLKIEKGWCVEFGASDGKRLSNTWNLWHERGWNAVLIEGDSKHYQTLLRNTESLSNVTAVNSYVSYEGDKTLDKILQTTSIPKDFELLSIDIDGDDYYIWKSIEQYQPKLVIIEHNPTLPPDVEFVDVPRHSGKAGFGSSVKAFMTLANQKGYELICCTVTNSFFVRKSLVDRLNLCQKSLSEMFQYDYLRYVLYSYSGRAFLFPGEAPYGSLRTIQSTLRQSKVLSNPPKNSRQVVLVPCEQLDSLMEEGKLLKEYLTDRGLKEDYDLWLQNRE